MMSGQESSSLARLSVGRLLACLFAWLQSIDRSRPQRRHQQFKYASTRDKATKVGAGLLLPRAPLPAHVVRQDTLMCATQNVINECGKSARQRELKHIKIMVVCAL